MARSFANVKLFSASLLDRFSHVLTRRGYAATTQSATREGPSYVNGKIASPKSMEDKAKDAVTEKVSWVPDPVTGYYKPQNTKDIDVSELRASLLSKNFNH